jgi:hypothetical protein
MLSYSIFYMILERFLPSYAKARRAEKVTNHRTLRSEQIAHQIDRREFLRRCLTLLEVGAAATLLPACAEPSIQTGSAGGQQPEQAPPIVAQAEVIKADFQPVEQNAEPNTQTNPETNDKKKPAGWIVSEVPLEGRLLSSVTSSNYSGAGDNEEYNIDRMGELLYNGILLPPGARIGIFEGAGMHDYPFIEREFKEVGKLADGVCVTAALLLHAAKDLRQNPNFREISVNLHQLREETGISSEIQFASPQSFDVSYYDHTGDWPAYYTPPYPGGKDVAFYWLGSDYWDVTYANYTNKTLIVRVRNNNNGGEKTQTVEILEA